MKKKMTYFNTYDQYENQLAAAFNRHPFFLKEQFTMDDQSYIEYLLQLGHFSFEFINWLQKGIMGIIDDDARSAIRYILHEELPLNAPTHQEERVTDLKHLGVSVNQILSSRPTDLTAAIIQRRLALIEYSNDFYDLKTIVAFRFDGEVLAAEVFRHISDEVSRRFSSSTETSRYYTPHYLHDLKSDKESNIGHADTYTNLLQKMIIDQSHLEIAKQQADRSLALRMSFHDQFIRSSNK